MGGYLAIPEQTPAGAIIAIMEIWGVNSTMRHHANEFADAGYICLVPDLFWRQQPGVELSDKDPDDVKKAFDLYYDFDYDLAVRDMEDIRHYLIEMKECSGKVGAVGYCLGGKLCYLMCCRTDIDCAVGFLTKLRSTNCSPGSGGLSARSRRTVGLRRPCCRNFMC
jgi:carboxymethylenebutenolidase